MKNSPVAFDSNSVSLFLAVDLHFDSGTVRLWNGSHDQLIDGYTYIGAGELLDISDIEETSEIAARGASITLTGLDSSLILTALTENYQNRLARIMFGSIVDGAFTTYTLFSGRMDVMTINESANGSTITISAENRLIDLDRPRAYRYTSEDQKAIYPDDLGLDYVADLQDRQINWGKA